MPEEIDPVALTLIIIYNSIVLAMTIKWLIPQLKTIFEELRRR